MQDTQYQDGVYFDMPETDYHRIPALSASGIKNLLISPVDFHARSWMNPAAQNEEDTDAQIIGTAYHKRVCEGHDRFYKTYARAYSAQREEFAVETMEQMRDALRKKGKKTDGVKTDLIARCERSGIPTGAVKRANYYEENEGKVFLSSDMIDSIEMSAAMIEKHPKLSKCFQGGFPEVTIIWTEEHQIVRPSGEIVKFILRFKARIDYLKLRALIDLKTFENRGMKAVEKAIVTTIASYKYHIQATFYMRAAEQAKKLMRDGKIFYEKYIEEVHQRARGDAIAEFCKNFVKTDEHDFYFVFQQKGIAPFARGFKFPRTSMFSIANLLIDGAIETYKQCTDLFGMLPWIDTADIETLEDEQFPAWAATDF